MAKFRCRPVAQFPILDWAGFQPGTLALRRRALVTRLYVGNLSWETTEDSLRSFFAGFGTVRSVSIILDRETGRSRGFGFVEMQDTDAEAVITASNGQTLEGREIRVDRAAERPQRIRLPGGRLRKRATAG
jgi:RNA recognition motif-containing protein